MENNEREPEELFAEYIDLLAKINKLKMELRKKESFVMWEKLNEDEAKIDKELNCTN